jgi:Secretion system C-terminal sorting domain
LSIFFGVIHPGNGQAIEWEIFHLQPKHQIYRNSIARSDSNILLFISDLVSIHKGEIWLLDTVGNINWKRQLVISGLVEVAPNSFDKFDNSSNYLVVGTGNDSSGANMTFYAIIDSAGNTLLSNTINYPSFQGGADGLILSDNSFLILGGRFNTDADLFIARANTNGIMWEKSYFHVGSESPRQLIDLFNGRFLVSTTSDFNAFSVEVDKEGNFYNPTYLDSNSWVTSWNVYRNSYNGGLYYAAFVDTGSNDFKGVFYSLSDSITDFQFDTDVVQNRFELNQDSNFVFVRHNGSQPGLGLQKDSIILSDAFFQNDGVNRGVGNINLLGDGKALITGAFRNPPYFNIWYSKVSGVGLPWVQDPCIISPPQIGFSWDYQFPSLTLTDTSFSGLQYLDTIYNRQWLSSSGDTSSQEQFTTFWDTTGNTTLDVTLIIENWYGCRDTISTTLSYWINGMEPAPTPSWEAKLYPNPAQNQITLDLDGKIISGQTGIARIYDIHGRVQEVLKVNEGDQNIDLSKFPPGLYILKIDINQESKYLRFVKGE